MQQLSERGLFLLGTEAAPLFHPAFGATLYPWPVLRAIEFSTNADGDSEPFARIERVPAIACGLSWVGQALVVDPGAQGGLAFTKAVSTSFGTGNATRLFMGEAYDVAGSPQSIAAGDLVL